MVLLNLDVKIAYMDNLPVKGVFLPDLNTIFINSNLEEHQQEFVLKHELLHCIEHRHQAGLYTATQAERLKMEAEANTFMLKEILNEYSLKTGVDVQDINPVRFLEMQGLSLNLEPKLRKILKENI